MKFTLFATAAFVAGAIAVPTSPSSYNSDPCDGLSKAYKECKAIQDHDYDLWQAAIKYEALQKSQYESCKKLEAKYEADYKTCSAKKADAKKAYDAAKKDEDAAAKEYNSCESKSKPEYKKKWDDAKKASKKAYNDWNNCCEDPEKKYEDQVQKCKKEGTEWKAAWEKNAAAEAELHKQEGICNWKRDQVNDCEKKNQDPKQPSGYNKPKGY
ncbi:uncharacterized protein MYCFIDRAFT_87246 [Pseudocercospora fijiensis CIRAD86]|uniref:Uncharacterized protein n=1 Tax=Pseudocercospora fijiensis (strain CIRAD86) TaxID=383855 RepID=M3A0J7_PSEFD|nr:uncharacterized protein MYCFIDRAFT_87246 [Pseudocercospora fijiensis CIRAD86]EME77931.1 hypothetical protein MYCFIDRAFT_87246 [Pseudocercospora fijiensis CIRAD86]